MYMKISLSEQKELKRIKSEVSEKLQKNLNFKKLQMKKEEVINYLIMMKDTKENKELIKKFNDLDLKLRELEQTAAYIITKEEKLKYNEKKAALGNKKTFEKLSKEEYEKKFNNLLKESNYLEMMKQRIKVFKELEKINNDDSSVLYKLDSLETEISTIETDSLREYLLEN